MNLYLSALGFSRMDSKEEARFIKAAIKQHIDEGFMLKNEYFNRAIVVVHISASTGLYIFGRYENKRFIYEYYYPFTLGDGYLENDELLVERHVDKESYSVICDESGHGVTLIFYLQNIMDYMDYLTAQKASVKEEFDLDRRNAFAKTPIKGAKAILSGLSVAGTIIMPVKKPESYQKVVEQEHMRRSLIADAKHGDEEAIASLTLADIDLYSRVTNRAIYEDVYSIVNTTFMPCGVECDQYSVIGEILSVGIEKNVYTGEEIYVMRLDCNGIVFTMAINKSSLLGEPAVGRRFKGQVWLQGSVKFPRKED